MKRRRSKGAQGHGGSSDDSSSDDYSNGRNKRAKNFYDKKYKRKNHAIKVSSKDVSGKSSLGVGDKKQDTFPIPKEPAPDRLVNPDTRRPQTSTEARYSEMRQKIEEEKENRY